jgi:hypothetical protein
MFTVQTENSLDKGERMQCTLAHGATVLSTCPHDEKGHAKHKGSGAFHAGKYLKVVGTLHPDSGNAHF